jgi:hypothetical protein
MWLIGLFRYFWLLQVLNMPQLISTYKIMPYMVLFVMMVTSDHEIVEIWRSDYRSQTKLDHLQLSWE